MRSLQFSSLLLTLVILNIARADQSRSDEAEVARRLQAICDPTTDYSRRVTSSVQLQDFPPQIVLPMVAARIDPNRRHNRNLGDGASQHDALDPECQVFEVLDRVWQEHCGTLDGFKDGAEDALDRLLENHPRPDIRLKAIAAIHACCGQPCPPLWLEPNLKPNTVELLRSILQDELLDDSARIESAKTLALFGKQHAPLLVATAEQTRGLLQWELVSAAMDALEAGDRPRDKTTPTVNGRLAKCAFQILDRAIAERASLPAANPFARQDGSTPTGLQIQQYDDALLAGRTVHMDFRPRHSGNLETSDYAATVQNARVWWIDHRWGFEGQKE